ncbi:hypothetical protein D3C85_1356950 [compost metagenome]
MLGMRCTDDWQQNRQCRGGSQIPLESVRKTKERGQREQLVFVARVNSIQQRLIDQFSNSNFAGRQEVDLKQLYLPALFHPFTAQNS